MVSSNQLVQLGLNKAMLGVANEGQLRVLQLLERDKGAAFEQLPAHSAQPDRDLVQLRRMLPLAGCRSAWPRVEYSGATSAA